MSLLPRKRVPSPASAPSSVVPKIEDISPEFARLTARDRDLRMRLGELAIELDELGRRPSIDPSASRVAGLIGGNPDDITPSPLVDRAGALRQEKADILEALEQIRLRIADERRNASVKAWQTLAPVHGAKVKVLAVALAGALRAHRDLEAFRGDVNESGLSWLNQPRLVANQVLGDAGDAQSAVRQLLDQAVRDGFARPEDVRV